MKQFSALIAALLLAAPAMSDDSHGHTNSIMIHDAYARAASPKAKVGAAFMVIMNHGDQDDRLIDAASDAAAEVMLHTHIEENGVMKMRHDMDGFEIPAGGMAALDRGGDHVMLMGLTDGLPQGETVTITLTFEKAGDITVDVPVDHGRKPEASAHSH